MRERNAAQQKAQALNALTGQTTGHISGLVGNVALAAQRQATSVNMVVELERQAADIGDIVKAVARIADQTNLLALNAAIEAARAGKHGKGFAVVADEVRTLAETSEKSARDIQDLVGQIQGEVKVISEGINASAQKIEAEAANGKIVVAQLEEVRTDLAEMVKGAQEIAAAALQSVTAAEQAMKGSEAIAAASEEQSSACEEAAKTVAEQTQAFQQSEQGAANLADLSEELKNSTDIAKSSEEVASAAEELSSAFQEINRSAAQVMVALDQIRKGAQTQASAAQESAAAISQIERGIEISDARARSAMEGAVKVKGLLGDGKSKIDSLVAGISESVDATGASLQQVKSLAVVSRRIDKIVDAITTVSIQTNMLAVNGAIEAARAGEFGKGFVVVATDIRNLAHDSAENADRIKDMVKGVQDQIAVVQRDLEEISAAALAEAEKAKAITTALVDMERDVQVIEDGNHQAVQASQVVVSAVSQIKVGVEQISAAAAQAEKSATEAAAAARQQSQSAEEMAAAIEEIASLADELQSA